jgi:hypothetical protein
MVTFTVNRQSGGTTWWFEWTRTGALTYVYFDGVLVRTTDQLWLQIEVGAEVPQGLPASGLCPKSLSPTTGRAPW